MSGWTLFACNLLISMKCYFMWRRQPGVIYSDSLKRLSVCSRSRVVLALGYSLRVSRGRRNRVFRLFDGFCTLIQTRTTNSWVFFSRFMGMHMLCPKHEKLPTYEAPLLSSVKKKGVLMDICIESSSEHIVYFSFYIRRCLALACKRKIKIYVCGPFVGELAGSKFQKEFCLIIRCGRQIKKTN